jgi:hypothetical protein
MTFSTTSAGQITTSLTFSATSAGPDQDVEDILHDVGLVKDVKVVQDLPVNSGMSTWTGKQWSPKSRLGFRRRIRGQRWGAALW